MSEQETQSLTASGSGKSEAEIAFELLNKLKGQGVWGERNISAILDMYAECLDAARGFRTYEGQNRFDAPITAPSAQPQQAAAKAVQQAPAQPQLTPQMQAAKQAQAHAQAQTRQVQTQAPQPVHAQQPVMQQAYKQG